MQRTLRRPRFVHLQPGHDFGGIGFDSYDNKRHLASIRQATWDTSPNLQSSEFRQPLSGRPTV
jgi:hypothetical protein